MSLPSVETTRDWPAKTMVDHEGDPLGRIAHIYLDRVTGQATWALVVPGRLRRRPTFVPLVQAVHEDDRVRVPVTRAAVRKAPSLRRRRELAQKHEARLLEHYGEVAGPASSHAGARQAPKDAEAGTRVPRWARQGLERATAVSKGAMTSRALRGALVGGLSLFGSVAANRRLAMRRQPSKGLLAASRAAAPWRRPRTARRGPFVVVVNARPARRRVPPPRPSLSQRRSPSTKSKLGLAVGLVAGYVLGARAGRERYDQIAEQGRRFWQRPEVQNLVAEGRHTTNAAVERAAGRASDQLQRARASMAADEQAPKGTVPERPSPTAKADERTGRSSGGEPHTSGS
jgi:hypothetical protein